MKNMFIGKYRLCDFITMSGTLSAIIGMILTINGYSGIAILLLLVCLICDSIDGLVARRRKNTDFEKTYGVELDSLSDVITFGVFPVIIAITTIDLFIIKIVAPLYVLCGVIRLAYFNTEDITKTNEKGYFKGVPITTISLIYPLIYLIKFASYNVYAYITACLFIIMGTLFIINIRVKKPDLEKILKLKK